MRRPSLKIFSRALIIIANEFFYADQACFHAIFGELKDHGFGAVENDVGVIACREGLFLYSRR